MFASLETSNGDQQPDEWRGKLRSYCSTETTWPSKRRQMGDVKVLVLKLDEAAEVLSGVVVAVNDCDEARRKSGMGAALAGGRWSFDARM